nr:MAG TPA: hypothetical protein [Caudoviricetes sp.]
MLSIVNVKTIDEAIIIMILCILNIFLMYSATH